MSFDAEQPFALDSPIELDPPTEGAKGLRS
jgi:hypothetical protein